MTHLGLFEGIGGFSLAARWMGWQTLAWCEWNEFGQRVLRHHFPHAEGFGDITKTDFTKYYGKIDIITGGFPCQPYSMAGKRKGKDDERHLWPHMLRTIREVRPRYVVGENVLGLVNWSGGLVFEEVQADLEAQGYEVLPFILPAAGVGAPHRRDRVWFIARAHTHPDSGRLEGSAQVGRNGKHAQRTSESGAATCASELRLDTRRTKQPLQGSGSISEDWVTTNPDQRTARPPRPGRKTAGDRSQDLDQQSGGKKSTQLDTRRGQFLPAAADTQSQPGERMRSEQPEDRQPQQGQPGGEGGENGSRPATDTDCRRRSLQKYWQKKSGQPTKKSISNHWENFPTQPPVCGGNDGLPRQLDGITFPRWRNESIKAYGNAIVPQVAFAIFTAIKETEEKLHL